MTVIPADWDDVSPAWMTMVLTDRFPGIAVAAVRCTWRDDGTNRRARFALTLAGDEPGPPVVFVKAEGAHRDVHARNGNLFNEPRLLASGCEHLPLEHAEPYAVLLDEDALDWLVVLEDVTLRGGDPRDATRPLTVAEAADGVRGLAALHRRYSGRPPAWLQTWAPTDGFRSGLARCIPLGLNRSAPTLGLAWSADALVDAWARYVGLLGTGPVTLLHADAHVGNCFTLPGGRVGFFDWQVARAGHWSQDVGHFLPGALSVEDRRAHERAIVAEHSAGDEAWTWYRASAVYGLAIWLSTLGTDGYQPHEVAHAMVERFATAVDDLESFSALESIEPTR